MRQVRHAKRHLGPASEQQSPLPADRESPTSFTPIRSRDAPAAPAPALRSRADTPGPRRFPEAGDASCPVNPWPH